MQSLLCRVLCSAWLLLFGLWFGVAPARPHKLPNVRPGPRVYRRQVAAIGTVGRRVFAVRLQVILA